MQKITLTGATGATPALICQTDIRFRYPALAYFPDNYLTAGKKFPLLISCHGTGEVGPQDGTQVNNLEKNGLPAVIKSGKFNLDFIVLAPQRNSWSPLPADVHFMLQDFLSRGYPVDLNNIFITGYSAGGQTALQFLQDYPADGVSSPVPMSAAAPLDANPLTAFAKAYMWLFCGTADSLYSTSQKALAAINAAYPGHARLTSYSGGHGDWIDYYDPAYTEVVNGKETNIYDWMMDNSNGAVVAPPVDPPVDPPVTAPAKTVVGTITMFGQIVTLYSDNTYTITQ